MRFTRILILSAVLCLITPNVVAAGAGTFEDGQGMTGLERITYISFVGIGLTFIGTAFFLFMERNDVARRHRPAVGLGVMITGIAGLQYALMQDVYIVDGSVPTDYRYADWITTVPLMAITFAVLPGKESFTDRRLFSLPGMSVPGIIIVGSLFMMVSGYLGQVEVDRMLLSGEGVSGGLHWYWFFQGLVGFLTILLVVGTPFTGAYGIDDSKILEPSIQTAMARLRRLVIFGWLIYPAGYLTGALEIGGQDGAALMTLVYNVADLVNKTAFVVIVLLGARNTIEAQQVHPITQDHGSGAMIESNQPETYDDSGLRDLAELVNAPTDDSLVDPDDDL